MAVYLKGNIGNLYGVSVHNIETIGQKKKA